MASRFVLDTNVYWYGAADPRYRVAHVDPLSPISYSAVVLNELRRSAQTRHGLATVTALHRRADRFLFAPDPQDWWLAAEYLATLLPRRGGPISAELLARIRKEQNDALIAISAWRKGYTVVTCDADFEPIRQHLGIDTKRLLRLPAP